MQYASGVATDSPIESLYRLLRPLSCLLSVELAEALVGLRVDEKLQARYDELADKNTAGTLSDTERAELQGFVDATEILSVLKVQAHARLAGPR